MRAVLPEPTGLWRCGNGELCGLLSVSSAVLVPTNANGGCSLIPVSSLDDGHFSSQIGARTVHDLVGVAMVVSAVCVTYAAVVRVSHDI